ncbi:hypothetical protein [Luteimicrobium sp. DT211]|uniref:hypothetical protein n=1 Tax=Luteimicrobium sp. DT211 TaxID=3393412 RepID=UPI003CFAB993
MSSRRRGTVVRVMVALALGAALLAACSTASGVAEPTVTPVPDASVQDRATCPLPENGSGVPTPSMPTPGRVPGGFVAVAAVECPAMPTVTDADGVWSAVERVRYAGDLAPLLAALAEPDDRPPAAGLACTADAEIVPPLWLVDADGHAVLTYWPVDACHKTKGAVRAALADLTVESRKTTKVALLTPRAALDADCETGWKLQPPTSHATSAPPTAAGIAVDAVRVCRYDVDPDQAIDTGDGTHVPMGTFASGGELRGDDVARVLALPGEGPLAPPCRTDPTQFAVVLPVVGDDTGSPVWVELDGCRRTWTDESTPRTAPAELMSLVAD